MDLEEIVEEVMEKACTFCHFPYIEKQDELDARCEKCPVEATLRKLLEK